MRSFHRFPAKLEYYRFIIYAVLNSLQGHYQHHFSLDEAVQDGRVVNYVRLTILLPNFGISRMILKGHIVKSISDSELSDSFDDQLSM